MARDFSEILKQKREKAGLSQTQCFSRQNEVIPLGQIEGAGTPVW